MLFTPQHITNANVASQEVLYNWDEWNVQQYFYHCSDDIKNRLVLLSDRGNMGLAVACGEWLYHRYGLVNDDRFPLHFLEGAWASCVFLQYSTYYEGNEDEWRGVVRGPLYIMMLLINEGLWTRDDNPNVSDYSLWMINLTRHVLPQSAVPDFEVWLAEVMARLEVHCQGPAVLVPPDEFFPEDFMDDVEGDYVPRELFDTTRAYDHSQRDTLINSFLRSLDPTQNPFMHSVEWLEEHQSQFQRTEFRHPYP